jgi:hypothetical protein
MHNKMFWSLDARVTSQLRERGRCMGVQVGGFTQAEKELKLNLILNGSIVDCRCHLRALMQSIRK